MKARILCAAVLLLLTSLTAQAKPFTTGNTHRHQEVGSVIPEIAHLRFNEAQQAVCIALAVYHEARGLKQNAQQAVAHVVMNRVRDGRFPPTPCAVVWQRGVDKKGRKVGAFNWTTLKKDHRPYEADAWETSQRVAYRVYVDRDLPDPTLGATHFYERRSPPKWASKGKNKKVIEGHVFLALLGN